MSNDQKKHPETAISIPLSELNTTTATTNTTTTKVADDQRGNNNLVILNSTKTLSRKYDVMHVVLRVACLSASLVSVIVMITAKEKSSISIYGFDLPLYSKWSFSGSFQYMVGVSVVTGVHSLLQFVMTAPRMLRKSSIFTSRNHAWLIFAADQVFAYVMISAGSAATGVTNLNHTGIKHAALPNFCKPLRSFCDRVGVSIAFAFLNCFLIAICAVLDIIWLSN